MARKQSGWVETDSANNAVATATKVASSGKQHVISSVSASFTSTKTQLLQLKDGSNVIWEDFVYDSREVIFPDGISITEGAACSAVLAASGTADVLGKVNLHGRTT